MKQGDRRPSPALAKVAELRGRLLELHRALVEAERQSYEKVHGRVAAGSFLELLLSDPAFAWLGPLTTVIVQLDELLDVEEEAEARSWAECVAELRALLRADASGSAFQRRYAELLQASPDVVLMHGAALGALRG